MRKTWNSKAELTLIGGPLDTQVITVPLKICAKSIAIPSETYFCEKPDGTCSIRRGERTPKINWTSYSCFIYKKESPVKDGIVNYIYDHSVEVNRCAVFLEKYGRRCGHNARPGL